MLFQLFRILLFVVKNCQAQRDFRISLKIVRLSALISKTQSATTRTASETSKGRPKYSGYYHLLLQTAKLKEILGLSALIGTL